MFTLVLRASNGVQFRATFQTLEDARWFTRSAVEYCRAILLTALEFVPNSGWHELNRRAVLT